METAGFEDPGLVLKETAAGWIVLDAEYDETISGPFATKDEAVRAIGDESTSRAERAYERQTERFYG